MEMRSGHQHDSYPVYEDLNAMPERRPNRQARSSMPWWNPRYWTKRVFITIGAIVTIIVIIVIVAAVVATNNSKKDNRYPNYSNVTYNIAETYSGENFFDKFNYKIGYDPAHGFVHYVPKEEAAQKNLTYAGQNSAILRVDSTEKNAITGRHSVRVESKNTYNGGLFIFDIKHTPHGCATWPALWLSDSSHWPKNGEIDIMEATNQANDGNQMTLHTTKDCSMDVKRKMSGSAQDSDCDHDANSNAGCSVTGSKTSFGVDFNDNGGGVMAVEWRDAGIRMWQFARNAIPSDITGKKPQPQTWGMANADFPNTDCDIGSHFKNNSIVANIDLCGDLVYAVWDKSDCPSNCTDIVANQPEAFKDAYWEFGAFDVYQPA